MSDPSTTKNNGGSLNADKTTQLHGLLASLGAFCLWGVIPVYFKLLGDVPPLEIIAHRIVWSLVLVVAIVLAMGRVRHVLKVFKQRKTVLIFCATTILIAVNWTTFIWAISNDHILQASLGYYINPLVNVLLGFVFLGERLNKMQSFAVGLATLAVILLTINTGGLPWVSLVLAFSFGLYGLLRKMAQVESVVGLTVETSFLFPLSLGYIAFLMATGNISNGGSSGQFYDFRMLLLLMGTGLVTAIPLILFAIGAQRLKLGTLGLLQYIAPTIHVFLAVYIYNEPLSDSQLVAFGLIWVGLFIYSWDGFRNRNKG
ncbi:MAG: EamA family transporter RarD [Sneathiella sp.]|nr:EamA family transporter RarD [Sneathiella sp.]